MLAQNIVCVLLCTKTSNRKRREHTDKAARQASRKSQVPLFEKKGVRVRGVVGLNRSGGLNKIQCRQDSLKTKR